jgi:hypothetical protein
MARLLAVATGVDRHPQVLHLLHPEATQAVQLRLPLALHPALLLVVTVGQHPLDP